MGPLLLVNLSWFSCDPIDADKFRCLQTELWGTFPSEVPISKRASNPASQAEKGQLSSRTSTFQKSRSIQSFLNICVWNIPTELGMPGGIVGVAWQKNWFQGQRMIMSEKLGHRNQKCLLWFNVALWSKPPSTYMEPKNTPEINEILI